MSWTTVDTTQNADNLNWGTTNLGSTSDQSTFEQMDTLTTFDYGSVTDISPISLTDLLGPVIENYLPEVVRPVSGDVEYVGVGGGSTRPTSGMLYPRGQG